MEHLINIACGVTSGLLVRGLWILSSEHDHVLKHHVKQGHKAKASLCEEGKCGADSAVLTVAESL